MQYLFSFFIRGYFRFFIELIRSFDRNGYRLGQGGGYYDRFLSAHELFSVGLAQDGLLLEEVPREVHDYAVCCLVTESLVLRFKSATTL